MNTSKKVLLTVVLVVLSLVLIAAGFASKQARVEEGDDITLQVGRVGATWNSAYYDGQAKISAKDVRTRVNDPSIKFMQPLVDVRFIDTSGYSFRTVLGPVYVHYNLSNSELKLWNQARLSIYYYDTWYRDWRECPSYIVKNKYTTRLACRIHAYGVFGLGMDK